MDGAFTTVCQIRYARLVSVKSMNCFFVFIYREIEVVMTKNSVVENFEQHPQLTF